MNSTDLQDQSDAIIVITHCAQIGKKLLGMLLYLQCTGM